MHSKREDLQIRSFAVMANLESVKERTFTSVGRIKVCDMALTPLTLAAFDTFDLDP